jgi:hypothetical protein
MKRFIAWFSIFSIRNATERFDYKATANIVRISAEGWREQTCDRRIARGDANANKMLSGANRTALGLLRIDFAAGEGCRRLKG